MDVLIVEDEREIAELIHDCLHKMGLQCRIAGSAADADVALAEKQVDAVTLDLGMPGRSGVDWLETVAERDPALARRTLVITGFELERDLVERLAQCGAGVLAKPFSLAELRKAVLAQLARPVYRT